MFILKTPLKSSVYSCKEEKDWCYAATDSVCLVLDYILVFNQYISLSFWSFKNRLKHNDKKAILFSKPDALFKLYTHTVYNVQDNFSKFIIYITFYIYLY